MAKPSVRTVKIKTVSFRSSIQLKPFQHCHIEATAEVVPGENPSWVLDGVKLFVADELIRAREGVQPVPQPAAGRFRDILDATVQLHKDRR